MSIRCDNHTQCKNDASQTRSSKYHGVAFWLCSKCVDGYDRDFTPNLSGQNVEPMETRQE